MDTLTVIDPPERMIFTERGRGGKSTVSVSVVASTSNKFGDLLWYTDTVGEVHLKGDRVK